MKDQTKPLMVVKFRILRTLMLFLVCAGFAFQFPISPAIAEKIPDEILAGVQRNFRIFVRDTTTDIQGIDDLQGRKVAGVRDNSGLFVIQKYGKAKPLIFNSFDEALLSLLSGNTDALVYPELPVLHIACKSHLEDHIKTVGKPLIEVKRAIAVGKGKPELLNKLDRAVKELIPTKEYKNIYARWYVVPAPYWDVGRVLILGGGVLVLVIVLFAVWHHLSLIRLNRDLKYALGEQKKAEEVIREDETRLKVALTPIDVAVFNQDLDLRYTWMYQPQIGYTTEQVVGKTDAELLPPDAARLLTEIKCRVLESGTGARGEVEVVLEDRTIYYDVVVEPLCNAARQVVGITGASLDITERKQAEEALRESEERFRTSVDNMLDPFGMYSAIRDQSGKIVDFQIEYINATACLNNNITRDDQIGKRLCELLPAHRESGLFDEYCRVVETGRALRKESLIYTDIYGTKRLTRIFDISVTKLGDGFAASWRDITERKRAEEALKTERKRLHDVLEAMPMMICLLTPDYHVPFANRAFREKFGESHGRHCYEYCFEKKEPCDFCETYRVLKTAEPHRWQLTTMDGDASVIDVYDFPLTDVDGSPLILEVDIDITERKRAEEKIKASLLEKETMLKEIHHRVKNNLQVISGLLYLQARTTKNPELAESSRKSQDRIRAMALIHEKLYNSRDFSKIGLADYVRSLSEESFQSHSMNPGKIDLTVQTDGEVYVDIIKAIPCGLILNELISNALKHAFPGDKQGKLQIIISETKDSETEIVVRDNGVGLPVDVDIHEPQSLGLDLVHGLVTNQLGGQIEVKRDSGTEFRITFPS